MLIDVSSNAYLKFVSFLIIYFLQIGDKSYIV